ncbi:Uncharacterised protein [BD1-7 clade bacterium]|uniref:BIG2 domain-containing protein n=1 Tax=BD1-7 clade bacterium TaxID=2029982 RepID=A0A5S9QG02_9GAMM|nr:Uncharacterised protein [BD1-7 clade bacterium]
MAERVKHSLQLLMAFCVALLITACEGDTREIVNAVDVGRLNLVSIQIDNPSNGSVIPLNTSRQIQVSGTNKDGTSGINLPSTPLFRSSDTSVVSVSRGGEISALKTGDATLQALYGGLTASIDVSVDVLTAIRVEGNQMPDVCRTTTDLRAIGIFETGDESDITTEVTWSASSNARVEPLTNGVEFAVRDTEQATLTATSQGITNFLNVDGQPTIEQITVTAENEQPDQEPTVAVGSNLQFNASATWADNVAQPVTQNITWSTENGNATIAQTGIATGVSQGAEVASGVCGDDLATGTRQFIVVPRPTVQRIEFFDPTQGNVNNPDARVTVTFRIDAGQNPEFLRSRVLFTNGTFEDVTEGTNWTSTDDAVVFVGNTAQDQDPVPDRDQKGALTGESATTGVRIDIEYSDGGTEPFRANLQIIVNGAGSGT